MHPSRHLQAFVNAVGTVLSACGGGVSLASYLGPLAIDGELSLYRKLDGTFDWKEINRDPYPSLEVYSYQDGVLQDTILTREETEYGSLYGLNPHAFNERETNPAVVYSEYDTPAEDSFPISP